ncbi:MAG TPA: AraC family transcriptional regulator [Thermoanaerobaculia bacterium]|nr:AraC family transcriptional regulator [Thermoanaerobaculia bacterium]
MCTLVRRGRPLRLIEPDTTYLDNRWLYSGGGLTVTRWWCSVPFAELTEEHRRDAHTVALVHRGSYLLESPRGRGLVDGTAAALYNPGEPFRGAHPNGCGDEGTALLLAPELVRLLVRRHRPAAADRDAPGFPDLVGHVTPRAWLRHRLLLAAIHHGEEALAVDEAAQHLLNELASCLLAPDHGNAAGCRPDPRQPADPRPYAERAALHLQTHFRGKVHLADVARAAYTSPFHLARLFRARTGTTVHRYLTRLRLQAALDELARCRGDLGQVAREVGFATHSHFTSAFRRELGCTPSEVRRALASRSGLAALRERLADG